MGTFCVAAQQGIGNAPGLQSAKSCWYQATCYQAQQLRRLQLQQCTSQEYLIVAAWCTNLVVLCGAAARGTCYHPNCWLSHQLAMFAGGLVVEQRPQLVNLS
jgi:hypothetical protein